MAFPIVAALARAAALAARGGALPMRILRRVGGGGGVRGGGPLHPAAAAEAKRVALQDRLNRLWAIDQRMNLFQRLNGLASETFSSFTHSISVSVVGGPAADLRRCWYLACAAAFGRYRNRVNGVGQANLEATWDVTGKAVNVTIAYINSGILQHLNPALINRVIEGWDSFLNDVAAKLVVLGGGAMPDDNVIQPPPKQVDLGRDTLNAVQFLHVGPDQVTVGGGWPDFLGFKNKANAALHPPPILAALDNCGERDDLGPLFPFGPNPAVDVLGELPRLSSNKRALDVPWGRVTPIDEAISRSDAAPKGTATSINLIGDQTPVLPDDGRIITTGEKRDLRVQPPRPVLDGKSRTSILGAIHAALHQPCYAPDDVGCMSQPRWTQGKRVYNPGGIGEDTSWLGLTDFRDAVTRVRANTTDDRGDPLVKVAKPPYISEPKLTGGH